MKMHRPIAAGVVAALKEIFAGPRGADKVIEKIFKQNRKWGSRDRRQFAETVYELVRWWRRYMWMAGIDWPPEDRPPLLEDAGYWRVLGVFGAKHNLEIDGAPQVRPRAEKNDLPRALENSFPDWLDSLAAVQVDNWDETAAQLNQPAPVFLRANRLKTDPESLAHQLDAQGFGADVVGPDALQLRERANLFSTPQFQKGLFELQDLHSQVIAPFLQVEPGQRVIDACAGAGGKTLHLAACMQNRGKIIALDVSDRRLGELRLRSRRAGCQMIEVRLIDSAKVTKRLENSADRLLLDVPCTGLGVLRRNPDAKWRLTREKVEALLTLQAKILDDYSAMVRKDGLMVYATCSILGSENQDQVHAFLERRGGEFELIEEVALGAGENGGDGFYAARLKRRTGQ